MDQMDGLSDDGSRRSKPDEGILLPIAERILWHNCSHILFHDYHE